jgi:hypothetical protein
MPEDVVVASGELRKVVNDEITPLIQQRWWESYVNGNFLTASSYRGLR